nr:helix-turn-helix domain-containing protein [Shewanella canadensis]
MGMLNHGIYGGFDEALHDTIDGVNRDVRNNTSITPSKKSREIVTLLYYLGIYQLKGSAQITATRLDISVHSIYRYP